MATRQVIQWEPNPGRGGDLIANMAEAKKIHERAGLRVRAWQGLALGVGGPRISYVLESDNLASFLRSLDKVRKDPAWHAFSQRVLQSPAPSAQQISSVVATEIPGLESGPLTAAPGSMMASVFQFQVKPGRLADAIASGIEAKKVADGMGATVSGSATTYAGAGAGTISMVFLFNSVEAMATYQEKAAANPAWQALLQRAQAADSPTIVISSGLVAEVAI